MQVIKIKNNIIPIDKVLNICGELDYAIKVYALEKGSTLMEYTIPFISQASRDDALNLIFHTLSEGKSINFEKEIW